MHGALIRRSHQAFTCFSWSRSSNVWCWLLHRRIRGPCQSRISNCVLFRSQEDVQGRVAMSEGRTEDAKHLAIVFSGLLTPLLNGHLVLSTSLGLPTALIGGNLFLILHELVHHVSVELFYESARNEFRKCQPLFNFFEKFCQTCNCQSSILLKVPPGPQMGPRLQDCYPRRSLRQDWCYRSRRSSDSS